MQNVTGGKGGLVFLAGGALAVPHGTDSIDLFDQHIAVQRVAVILHAGVDLAGGKQLCTFITAEHGLEKVSAVSSGQPFPAHFGVGGHQVAVQVNQGSRTHEFIIGQAGMLHFLRAEEKALAQNGGGHIALLQGLHPELQLLLRDLGHALHAVIQAAHKVGSRVFAVLGRHVGKPVGGFAVTRGRGGMQSTIVSCLCCCIRNRGSRGRTLCGGGFRLGSLIFKPGRTGHRGDQHSAVDAERQQHASGQISGFFGCGALAKAAVGNQQEQRCQRQVNQFGRCQQDAEHRQRQPQPHRQHRAVLAAKNRLHAQRSKGKRQPQQQGIPAERSRQMQRHGQQSRRSEYPPAKRRGFNGQRR